jgi:hypothetical protein
MAPLDDIFCISLVITEDIDNLILEDLRDHIVKHFGQYIPQDQIEKALDNPGMAIRLAYGLYKGIITDVDEPDAVAKVKDLRPQTPEKEHKAAGKSEQERSHDAAKARARNISPIYWLWVMAVWKANPETHIDEGVFDYLQAENIKVENILDKSYEEIEKQSIKWHNEQFAQKSEGGAYALGPDSPEAVEIGGYWFIPVNEHDQGLEGAKMQNCIGRQCRINEKNKIWSMRNKFNNPHASIQITKQYTEGWQVSQIKGKQNKKPIDRYEQPIMAFVHHIIVDVEPQLKISNNSDFWYFASLDPNIWLPRAADVSMILASKPVLADQLNQDVADEILVQHISSFSNDSASTEAILPRVSVEAVEKLFKQSTAPMSPKFFAQVLRHKKLTEESALELLNSGDLRRSARLIIFAAYEPDRYLNELMKADIEDISGAIKNYIPSIDAFDGQDPFFADIYAITPHDSAMADAHGRTLTSLLRKVPSELLLKMASEDEHTLKLAFSIIIGRSDISTETKIQVCNALPNQRPDELQLWFRTLSVDELRLIRGRKDVDQLVRMLDNRDAEWSGKKDESGQYYLEAENADNIGELQSLMRQPVVKTNKKLQQHILRKIARLRRLEALAT